MRVTATAVTKAFGRGPVVLRADGLELSGPGLVHVVGANGAGKSTLLRLLAGVTRPTRGRVAWEGGSRAFAPERFRATGALRAGELLRAAGAAPLLGVEALAERRMGELSQGQAQRVALAAALGRPAGLVVLDEPFTALDADTALRLVTLLEARAEASLIVLADHEARLPPATTVLVSDGRAAIGRIEAPRALVRTGPAPAAPLAGAERDGDGWRALVPTVELQAALAALVASGIEIREVRP